MKIYTEIDLYDWLTTKAWGGAVDRIALLTDSETRKLADCLEDYFESENISDSDLNEFIWFDTDFWCQWLGYETFDELIESSKNREE